MLTVAASVVFAALRRPAFRQRFLKFSEDHEGKLGLAGARLGFAIACLVVLFASGPWGGEAAKHDIMVIKTNVAAGCCFNYFDGTTSAVGKVLAMDKDHLFLVTRKGLLTLSTAGLQVTRTPGAVTKRRRRANY